LLESLSIATGAFKGLDPLIIALIIIIAWFVLLYVLAKKSILEKLKMSLMGPFIMWKTVRGRKFLDRLAKPKRFWKIFGDFSVALCIIIMILLTAFLIWSATLVPSIPRESAPRPELLLGVPGLNPIIPIGYGILGLVVAIVFHEFFHGILARVAKVRLQSLGVLLFIVPIGAFVEPDEDELKKLPRRKRARLFAAGPTINILLALLFAVIFSSVMMSSVRPGHEGVGITEIYMENSPAEQAGLVPGMIIFSANGTNITNLGEFVLAMDRTTPGQDIEIKTYFRGEERVHNITLAASEDGRAIIGVRLMTVTTAYFHPIEGAGYFGGVERSILYYVFLPFLSMPPTQEPLTDFYVIEGPWSSIPASMFWVLAASVYWIFWINIMLGATNVLPAVPLDGGYIFRDGLDKVIERLKKDMKPERREVIVRNVSYALALTILALILWQVVGPYLF